MGKGESNMMYIAADKERCVILGTYIVENRATVRQAAARYGISKSTVHKDISERLPQFNRALYLQVKEVLDVNKAQRIMSSIDEDTLSDLPAVMQNANGTKVLVGPENVADELKDTSVVMTKFDIGDGMQGMIGVVGPTRMDYAKVTARLSYFAESLSKVFAKPDQMQLPEPASEDKET